MLNLKPENSDLIRDTMGFAWNLTKITPADLDRIIDAARAEGAQPKTKAILTQLGVLHVDQDMTVADLPEQPNLPVVAAPSRARLDAVVRKAGKIVDGPCQLSDIRRLADLVGQLATLSQPRSS